MQKRHTINNYLLPVAVGIRKCFVFLVITLFTTTGAIAQTPILFNYTASNGLPSSETYNSFQDSNGYIWIATDGGVARFNGYSFTRYTTDDGLSDNTVFGFAEDYQKRLWFRTFNGKLCYFKNEKFIPIPANDTLSKVVRGSIFSSLVVDKNGTIWIGLLYHHAFYKIDPPYLNRNFTCINTDTINSQRYIISVSPSQLIYGSNNTVYKSEKIVYSWLNKTTTRTTLPALTAGTPLFKALNYKKGLLFSNGNEVYWLPANQSIAQLIYTAKNRIIELTLDNHTLWIGTNKGGVICFDLLTNKTLKHFLNGLSISGITIDKDNGIWLTTLEKGIYYTPDINTGYYNTNTGLPSSKINTVISKNGLVFCGSAEGSISQIKEDTIINRRFRHKETVLTSAVKLIPYRGNQFFCDGVRFNEDNFKNGTSSEIPLKHLILNSKSCLPINDTEEWVFNYNELLKFNLAKNQKTESYNSPSRIFCMLKWKNLILLGCSDGLWTFNGKDFSRYNPLNGVPKVRITDMCFAGNNRIALATKGNGVSILYNNQLERNITIKDGLLTNLCNSIYYEDNGSIWVCSNFGISEIRKDQSIITYTLKDGLPSNEINAVTICNNKIYAASNDGLFVLNKKRVNPQEKPMPVYLKEILINHLPVNIENDYRLNHLQNNLSINFEGLSYKSRGKIKYRFKLFPADKNWNYTEQTQINYNLLPPGDYRFYLEALNSNGTWSKCKAIPWFYIDKPFYKKTTFILIVVLLTLGLSYLFLWYRIRKVKSEENKKIMAEKKLIEHELKALRAQMNPHFIFNALNSIQNYILNNDSISAYNYLAKYAKLTRNILDFSGKKAITLHEEIQTLELYIELEKIRFDEKSFDYKLTIEKDLNLSTISIPSLIIQPFVENAIWHGLMHKEGKRTLEIRISWAENRVKCEIEDNGIGRLKSEEINKNKKKHESKGINITIERLQLINKTSDRTFFFILDKFDENNQPAGTIVELYIPVITE